MSENDPGELADHLEREADDLGGQSRDLQESVQDVAQDWRQKRADGQVPGAQPEQPEERPPEDRSGEEDPAHDSPAGGEGAPS